MNEFANSPYARFSKENSLRYLSKTDENRIHRRAARNYNKYNENNNRYSHIHYEPDRKVHLALTDRVINEHSS